MGPKAIRELFFQLRAFPMTPNQLEAMGEKLIAETDESQQAAILDVEIREWATGIRRAVE